MSRHSVYAQSLSEQIKQGIFDTFFSQKTTSYLVYGEDFFPTIDNLMIDPTQYIIINFGIDLNSISNGKTDGLIDNSYKKEITIYNLPYL